MSNSLAREKKTIAAMVSLYCHGRHSTQDKQLCQNCDELLQYALRRLDKCPFETEKPPCIKCTIHCYKDSMRKQIREVMKYAGPRMIATHPILALNHLLKGHMHKTKNKNKN